VAASSMFVYNFPQYQQWWWDYTRL